MKGKRRRKVNVTLAGVIYKSMTSVKLNASRILKTHRGKRLHGPDQDFVYDLVRHHPDYESDLAVGGIKSVEVAKNKGYGTFAFLLTRQDGETRMPSISNCVGPAFKSPDEAETDRQQKRIRGAFRSAIHRDQIMPFRRAQFAASSTPLCTDCGKMLSERGCAVDHINYFETLMQNFLVQEGLTLASVEAIGYDCPIRSSWVHKLADNALAKRWAEYHRKFCNLQMLCHPCNQKRGGPK